MGIEVFRYSVDRVNKGLWITLASVDVGSGRKRSVYDIQEKIAAQWKVSMVICSNGMLPRPTKRTAELSSRERETVVKAFARDLKMRERLLGLLKTCDTEVLNAGGRAYVHCWGGRGRTGTAVCCWMIRHGIVAPNQAADHLQTLIRHNAQAFYPTPEFETQRDFVRNWIKGQ